MKKNREYLTIPYTNTISKNSLGLPKVEQLYSYIFKIFIWLCQILVAGWGAFLAGTFLVVAQAQIALWHGFSVSQPGIEPVSYIWKRQILNYWTPGSPKQFILMGLKLQLFQIVLNSEELFLSLNTTV